MIVTFCAIPPQKSSLKLCRAMEKDTPEEKMHYTVINNAAAGRGGSGGTIG